MLISRNIVPEFTASLGYFPVVALIGPRQVGKTTLAKMLIKKVNRPTLYLDLELQSDLNKLNDAELFLSYHADKLVIIDEVQHKKELYPLLRALVDKTGKPGQFLLLGSASPELIRHSSESLAGRIIYHELYPFNIQELSEEVQLNDLWLKGGFPKALFAPNANFKRKWLNSFVDTYLNRDLLQLGLNVSPTVIRNLWNMMAHLNGQLFNASSIAKSLGVTVPTIKRYVNFLEEAFLLQSLHPFHYNMQKRLVKSPKIYLSDTGILHFLLGINNFNELTGSPAIGNSWESFVINQVLSAKKEELGIHFYRTHHGAEVDIVFTKGLKAVATAEIKYSNSPKLSKGNFIAIDDLNTTNNFVITPSSDDYFVKTNIRVCSIKTFIREYLPNL